MKAPSNSPESATSAGHSLSLSEPRATPLSAAELASRIDHTLLKPEATEADISRICEEARTHHFATVCVRPGFIPLAAKLLKGSGTLPIAVIDFPKGEATPAQKAREAREAISSGAREIDMVLNVPALKQKDYETVLAGIQSVVQVAGGIPVKVILETGALNDDEKIIACALSKAAGAAFVKTSTGFGPGGATVEDVALMRRVVGVDMKVKASGGIRSREDALMMIRAGADRLGTSAGVAIVTATDNSGGTAPASAPQSY